MVVSINVVTNLFRQQSHRQCLAILLQNPKIVVSPVRPSQWRSTSSLLIGGRVYGGVLDDRRSWNEERRSRNTILSQPQSQQRLKFSSRSSSGSKRFDLKALPFSISPEEALETFRKWAEVDQGLRYLLSYDSIRIGAAYVPVWSFDVNIRFKGAQSSSKWKPPMFSAYDESPRGKQDTIFVPNLSAYAGYSYRRSLINPVHSTTLVFMGDQTQPFGGWMLKDMMLKASGNPISVVPDAWNSTQGRAFSVIKEELQGMADASWPHADAPSPKVQTQVVNARRVFMPTFVIEYKIFGLEYRAFVSGCDRSAPVGGLSHQLFGNSFAPTSPEFHQTSRNFLSQVWYGGSQLLQRFSLPMLFAIFRPFFNIFGLILLRLWAAFPIAGAAGGLFAGFRKILQPWMDNRRADAEWERQRQHEAQMKDDDMDVKSKDDFDDVSGSAQAYFNLHKIQILRALSGEYDHKQGDFDWYADWQAWAQQQWSQQQQQQQQQQQSYQQTYQQQQQYQQQYQQQQRQQVKPKADEFKWPFNPDDPYDVLGIKRGATSKEVSDAFRKQMLQHHPDTQPNASEAQKRRSVERTKLISEAYRKIKQEMKGR